MGDEQEYDQRVARLNGSIVQRLSAYVDARPHLPEAKAHDRVQRKFMRDHQPDGGKWGSPCLGEHAQPTSWPCEGILRLDSPMAYFD